MSEPRFNFESELTLKRLDTMQKLLEQGPMTPVELIASMHVSKTALRAILDHFEGIHVHIAGWRAGRANYSSLWAWGPGESVPEPAWIAVPKKVSRRRARVKMQEAARLSAAQYKPRPVFRHPMDVLFYGPAA
jgi:hypothetical protein